MHFLFELPPSHFLMIQLSLWKSENQRKSISSALKTWIADVSTEQNALIIQAFTT